MIIMSAHCDTENKENKELTITSIKYLFSSTIIVCQRIASIAILHRNHNKQPGMCTRSF